MAQNEVLNNDIRFATALAGIKLTRNHAVLDLTADDYNFLTRPEPWLSTDRNRAGRCIEACIYGTLDYVGFSRFSVPAEFVSGVIAFYVHPVNVLSACHIMEGANYTQDIINGVEAPLSGAQLFAFTLRVLSGDVQTVHNAEDHIVSQLRSIGVE